MGNKGDTMKLIPTVEFEKKNDEWDGCPIIVVKIVWTGASLDRPHT
jgi:hypothetical protein